MIQQASVQAREDAQLLRQCVAEMVGTFMLVLIGVGVVHTAVLTGAQAGLWQVAIVWGIGVALAIFATGAVSGAHLNPAVTIAVAAWRGFPWRNVVPYILAQLMGAILAALLLHAVFGGVLAAFESAHGLVRGGPGSDLSAMTYGQYFPNPAMLGSTPSLSAVTMPVAALAEIVGTAFLAFVIFAVTDCRNTGRPAATLAPVMIGLTVAILISIFAPISQGSFNPARDLGPRLVAYVAGWGSVAIPGPHGGWFAVYIVAPIIGALLGGAVYQCILRPTMPAEPCETTGECPVTLERVTPIGG
jgi:glycerol uptake facilitator protein